MTEREGFILEGALQLGLDYVDDDAETLQGSNEDVIRALNHFNVAGQRHAKLDAAERLAALGTSMVVASLVASLVAELRAEAATMTTELGANLAAAAATYRALES